MKLPIDQADYPQLVKFAQKQQLDVKYGSTNKADLLALIRAAFPTTDEIEVEDAAPVVTVAAGAIPLRHPNLPAHHYKNDPPVLINISSDPGLGGDRHIPLSVNGDMILVARDQDVEIPYRFYNSSLKDAVETQYRQVQDPATGRNQMIATDVHAVRFSVKRLPSPEEIADFHARTKDVRSGERRKAA